MITPFFQVAFFVVFLNYFAADFALGAVSVALNGVGHRLVGWNQVFAVGTLHVIGQSLVLIEAIDHGLFASKHLLVQCSFPLYIFWVYFLDFSANSTSIAFCL